MKRMTITLLALCMACCTWGQTYEGKVVDDKHKKAIETVTVVLLGENDNPMAYTYTSDKGTFALSAPAGKHPLSIAFTMIGYARKTVPVGQYRNGQTVELTEHPTEIKAVNVTSRRLRKSSDTLTYSVAGYRQRQDRTIADVIAKMPGLEVKPNGAITYQGKPINKFYIEGMDLLGAKYGQASENLSADKVEDVQVLEKHQPVRALQKIVFSEQAALNIVLKDDAKDRWTGAADVGTGLQLQRPPADLQTDGDKPGVDWLRDSRLMGMYFGHRKQSISMYKCNNTGQDIQREVQDLTHASGELAAESGLLRPITLGAPQIDQERYLFNDTHLAATNWLFRTRGGNDLRLQLNMLHDKENSQQKRETYYSDVENSTLLKEATSVSNRRDEWKGEASYRVNKDRLYLTNTLRGYMDFDRSSGTTLLNDSLTPRRVRPRRRSLADDFDFIRTLQGTKSFSLCSRVRYDHLPATMLLARSAADTIQGALAYIPSESLTLNTLQWNTFTYFRHRVWGMYLTYKAGFNTLSQHMDVDNPETSDRQRYHEYRWYVTPQINFTHGDLKVDASTRMSWLARYLGGENGQRALAEPTMHMSYDITSKLSASAGYSYMWNPTDIKGMYSIPVFTDYITMESHTGRLEHTASHMLNGYLKYGNPLTGFFVNTSFVYTGHRHEQLYEATMKDNIYRRKATDGHANAESYDFSGRLSKTFGWAKTIVSLQGVYEWSNYDMLLSGSLTPYRMRYASVEFNISARPLRLLSFEEKSTYEYSRQINRTAGSLSTSPVRSFYHKLRTFFIPGHWQIEWDNECYHSNDRSVNFTYFSDFSVAYRTQAYEVSLGCNNLLGSKRYERTSITTYRQIYTVNRLRPRELLAKVSLSL